MIDDLEEMLKTAVCEVFLKMLRVEARSVPIDSGAMGAETHIASAVGFIGDMTGVTYIYASATFANKLTSAMLEKPESDVQGDEMVNDAMVERGMACVLTSPRSCVAAIFRLKRSVRPRGACCVSNLTTTRSWQSSS